MAAFAVGEVLADSNRNGFMDFDLVTSGGCKAVGLPEVYSTKLPIYLRFS